MSTSSNDQGRAYEYAWMNALYEALSAIRKTKIAHNSSLDANRRAWDSMDTERQERWKRSACAAVHQILALEPRMSEEDDDELLLEFQKDGAGTQGDVRDIVIKRNSIQWEVGLSIKHNHEAVKHSRLSHSLDFGKEWFGIPCTPQYWAEVKPIFDRLKTEKANGKKWSELPDKEEGVYVPLLNAFMEEVNRAYQSDASVPEKMVAYLIGVNDYYKVVSQDKKQTTLIHTFNMHNTLGQPSKTKGAALDVPTIQLPTKLKAIQFKQGSKNTVEMQLNHSWQLSFRIHNASTKVEPSLKFDIQFIQFPDTILDLSCQWK